MLCPECGNKMQKYSDVMFVQSTVQRLKTIRQLEDIPFLKRNNEMKGEFYMNEIIVGIFTGIISSLIVSEIYRRKEEQRERKLKFRDDQQMFSKYLGVIINELELYEKTQNSEQLIRILNEPRIFYSFTEKNLSQDSLTIIVNASKLLNELEARLKKKELLTKYEKIKYISDIYRHELNVLKIKLKEKNR